MLNSNTFSTYEKTFPQFAAINAVRSIRPDSTAKAILDRITMGKKSCEKLDKQFNNRSEILKRHSSLSVILANGYLLAEKFWGYSEAAKRLDEADRALMIGGINLSVTDCELCEIADSKARKCELKIMKANDYTIGLYNTLCESIRLYEIAPPTLDKEDYTFESLVGAINRFACRNWWRRRLRKKQADVIEQIARDLRVVHKKAAPYVSDVTLNNRRQRKKNSDEIMSKLFVVPDGANFFDEFESLKEIVDKSSNSGYQQASELMVRIRGFEDLSKMNGHVGEFYTMTAPSRFHSVYASGIPNRKYNGSTPVEAQEYFNNIWKRARARFNKADIHPYGFRVVEPHHDGCPHWHMLVFLDKGQSKTVRKILKQLCMEDSPSEVRTSTTRFKAVRIDPKKGSAAGYIAKYITKAITGTNISSVTCQEAGELPTAPAEAAERATTWASTFCIRRFQQIGGPSVSVWRELRKLGQGNKGKCEVANTMNTSLDLVSRFALEKVRAAADASDWAAFCIAMGGVAVKRKNQTVRIHYQIPDIVDYITGEISRSESLSPYFATKYGDIPARRIIGVAWDATVVITRKGTSKIMSERELEAQRTIMRGVADSINSWVEDGRFLQPSKAEMDFLESCCIEDIQNMYLFMDYEPLASAINSDEVAGLDLCQ